MTMTGGSRTGRRRQRQSTNDSRMPLTTTAVKLLLLLSVIRVGSNTNKILTLAFSPTTTTGRIKHGNSLHCRFAKRKALSNESNKGKSHNKNRSAKKQPNRKRTIVAASRDVSLAIVPPDQVWDTLQRARHLARDASYQKWPPCLRLFHPFAKTIQQPQFPPKRTFSKNTNGNGKNNIQNQQQQNDIDLALTVASVIDKYQIAPFEIQLTGWSIIPHAEAMEADWNAMSRGATEFSDADGDTWEDTLNEEQKEVRELISQIEQKGRRNLLKRAAKKNQPIPKEQEELPKDSPQALWEKQKQMYEEYNGPCVVCLEPDDESRERILELRDILLTHPHLKPFAAYSPTLTQSDTFGTRKTLSAQNYRPIVPIASFPTVTSAVEMARRLRRQWEPLSFTVTDLHLVSTGENVVDGDEEDPSPEENELLRHNGNQNNNFYSSERHIPGTVGTSAVDQTSVKDKQMGCDALIMLAGEELEMDNQLNGEMANLIAKEGQAGGQQQQEQQDDLDELDISPPLHNDEDLDLKDGDIDAIYQFLDDDDEEDMDDEGTVLVIGRTHFFTGEMRSYVGMPAMSQVDSKDQALGTTVSAAARRRGAVHRSVWNDGEWGKKQDDVSPWSKAQRSKKRY